MLNGDELLIIGTAQPENDTSKPARSDVPSKVTNNTQIFRTPFEISGSLQASGFQVRRTSGRGRTATRASSTRRTSSTRSCSAASRRRRRARRRTARRAARSAFITTNQTDAGGDLSEAEFNAFMLQVMRYGPGRSWPWRRAWACRR
jgi:hypothetical protein